MNVQLERVLSDMMGVTGQAIIRAIVAGERDVLTLAQLRNPACKSSEAMLAKALTGTWKPELLFVLTQALVIYDVYTAQMRSVMPSLSSILATWRHAVAIRKRHSPICHRPKPIRIPKTRQGSMRGRTMHGCLGWI
jgi:transposase